MGTTTRQGIFDSDANEIARLRAEVADLTFMLAQARGTADTLYEGLHRREDALIEARGAITMILAGVDANAAKGAGWVFIPRLAEYLDRARAWLAAKPDNSFIDCELVEPADKNEAERFAVRPDANPDKPADAGVKYNAADTVKRCPKCNEDKIRVSYYGGAVTDVWCDNCGDVTREAFAALEKECKQLAGGKDERNE
jgi:hypothetical protein